VRRTRALRWIARLAAVSWALAPGAARADERRVCAEAHAKAQESRRDGRLLRARSELALCARPACPAVLREECAPWAAEVEAATPTLVIDVRDDGRDVADASVSIDGEEAAAWRTQPVAVDPGDRRIRAAARDGRTVERTVSARAGEKAQRVRIDLPPSPPLPRAATPPPRAPGDVAPAPKAPAVHRPVPTATYVLGAAGAVGLGLFGAFAIAGRVQQSDLEGGCGRTRTCSEKSVDAMYRSYAVADISLGIGAASAAAALVVFLVRPTVKPKPASIHVGPAGAGVAF
jgi:hypothetical protein